MRPGTGIAHKFPRLHMASDTTLAPASGVAYPQLTVSEGREHGNSAAQQEELEDAYPDPSWRHSLFETSRILEFLTNCILKEKYKIPDEVNGVVHLTQSGNLLMQRLITKHDVPAKEARLLCLLRLVHREPLVDLEKTSAEALRSLVSDQLVDGSILLPFILGRQLYDRAADLFEDARDSLTYAETLELMDGTPVGVFQSGPYISGPFGLLRSEENRWFGPRRTIPLHHCSELTCSVVHRTRLSTDPSAPINEFAPTMERATEALGEDKSEWGKFIESGEDLDGLRFDDETQEPLTLAFADLLGDAELRTLLNDLLDNTQGYMRELIAPYGLQGKADSVSCDLNRAQLIQLLLLAPNRLLVSRIDKLVVVRDESAEMTGRIDVPPGEIRRLQTTKALTYGTFGLFPQISSYGLRFTSSAFDLGPMRLKRLVDSLYRVTDHAEVDELQWQLRDTEGEDPKEQLDEFVRSESPDEVVRRLILARRTNQIMASERLGIDFEDYPDDSEFVRAVLWKLGFYNYDFEDRNAGYWEHHGRIKRFAQTAGVGARVDPVDLRSKAVNYFVELEGVLDDSLAFTTWALTNDHIGTDNPFAYLSRVERLISFERLNEHERGRDSGDEVIRLGESNTLYPLIRGFGILASLLRELASRDSAAYLRPSSDYPKFAKHTDLKRFPFIHSVPFLDLLPSSQERIIDTLESVRQGLEEASVHSTRNDYLHYRATVTDLPRLDSSLEAAEKAVSRLEADGMCRLIFSVVGDVGDGWGRRVFTLRNSRRRELSFARPSAFDWNRMPQIRQAQYLMPAAIYAGRNEMLRFRAVYETAYSDYWSDYPRRRLNRSSIGNKPGAAQEAML